MGFNVNEGYYEKHVNKEGYKVTNEQQQFNLVDINDIRKGIEIATAQWEKDMKEISKVRLKDGDKDISKANLEKTERKEEQAEIIPLNRTNIENLNRNGQRVSGGEER